MKPDDILLLGLNQSVSAIAKADGRILWKTELPGSWSGDDFVTLLCDGHKVFAHTQGKLHCLDLQEGRILWSNSLSGYGYGVASLGFSNGMTAPDCAAVQNGILAERRSRNSLRLNSWR